MQVFAWASLPPGHVLKAASGPLEIKNHRRYIESRSNTMWVLRVVYKVLRAFYGAVWFYFLPMVVIVLPLLCVMIFRDFQS